MSLSRTALRYAVIEALNPYATIASGPWPTDAGGLVYDSRIDPIAAAQTIDALSAAIASLESKPLITVYTEEQETTPQAGDYPADMEIVDLVVQIQIGARGEIEVENAAGAITVYGASTTPATDGDAESILDNIEEQVRLICDPEFLGPTNALFRGVAMERRHIGSTPERQPDRAVRLAMRTLKMKIRVKRTRWPPFTSGSPPTGLDALPDPLKTVAKALNTSSAAYARCLKLAASVRAAPTLTPLGDIRINTNLDRAAAPANPAGSDSDVVADVTPPSFDGNFTSDFG